MHSIVNFVEFVLPSLFSLLVNRLKWKSINRVFFFNYNLNVTHVKLANTYVCLPACITAFD